MTRSSVGDTTRASEEGDRRQRTVAVRGRLQVVWNRMASDGWERPSLLRV